MEEIKPILDILYQPQAWFLTQGRELVLVIIGLCIATTLTLAGFVLARLGYKPLWAVLLIVPTLNVIAFWALAFKKFPIETMREKQEH